MIIIDAMR